MSGVPVNFNGQRVAFIPGFCKKILSFLTLRWGPRLSILSFVLHPAVI